MLSCDVNIGEVGGRTKNLSRTGPGMHPKHFINLLVTIEHKLLAFNIYQSDQSSDIYNFVIRSLVRRMSTSAPRSRGPDTYEVRPFLFMTLSGLIDCRRL